MPLFHLSAAPTVLAPMLVGGTSVLAAAFHPGRVWDEIRNCGAVGFAGAVRWCRCCGACRGIRATPRLGIRFISAAPIAADMYREIEQRYRCRVVTMYGMTEAFPIAYKAVSEGANRVPQDGSTRRSTRGSSTAGRSRRSGGSARSPAGRGLTMQ